MHYRISLKEDFYLFSEGLRSDGQRTDSTEVTDNTDVWLTWVPFAGLLKSCVN